MSPDTKLGGPDETAQQHPNPDQHDEIHDQDSTKSPASELPRPSFTFWLKAQRHRHDLVGHFATDVTHDPTWPAGTTSRHLLHAYLYQEHALDVVHEALDVAWYEWLTLVPEGVV